MGLYENLMARGAMKLVRDCAGVRKEDVALIVCDYKSFGIANEISRACLAEGARTGMLAYEPGKNHGEPPPEFVGASMGKATVAFLVTTKSISHTQAVRSARNAGCRIITMPEFLPSMLVEGAIEADFLGRAAVARRVKEKLTEAKKARIVCPETGTDLNFVLEGREARTVDGLAREPGTFAAPPNIEACIAPVEDETNGVYVVNLSIAGIGLVESPVRLVIEKGHITAIEGGKEAKLLQDTLAKNDDPNCYRIGELGIGLNPNARACGSLLEDEAVLGTVHIAAGNNASNFKGGQIVAPVHIDMIAAGTTVTLDDCAVIEKGVFKEELFSDD